MPTLEIPASLLLRNRNIDCVAYLSFRPYSLNLMKTATKNPTTTTTEATLKETASWNDFRVAYKFLSGATLTPEDKRILSFFDGAEIRIMAAHYDLNTI